MFRKFFGALANLVKEVDNLTASVKEANENFRSNLALDFHGEPEQIDHQETGEAVKPERRRKATTK